MIEYFLTFGGGFALGIAASYAVWRAFDLQPRRDRIAEQRSRAEDCIMFAYRGAASARRAMKGGAK